MSDSDKTGKELMEHHQQMFTLSASRKQFQGCAFSLDELVDGFGDLRDSLEDISTHFFEHRMVFPQREAFLADISCVMKSCGVAKTI